MPHVVINTVCMLYLVFSYYFIHVMNFSAKLEYYFQSVAKVCDF